MGGATGKIIGVAFLVVGFYVLMAGFRGVTS